MLSTLLSIWTLVSCSVHSLYNGIIFLLWLHNGTIFGQPLPTTKISIIVEPMPSGVRVWYSIRLVQLQNVEQSKYHWPFFRFIVLNFTLERRCKDQCASYFLLPLPRDHLQKAHMACAFRAFLAKFSNLYCTLAFKMAQILDQHFQIFVQEKKK